MITVGDPPPLTPGQIVGITIAVLVFLAIVIPLLVICLDENKKRATIAKLKATKARIARIRVPRPRLPRPRLPRRQPRRQPVTPTTQPSNTNQTETPTAPQPPAASPPPVAPQPPTAPQHPMAPAVPKEVEASNQDSKADLPPPYPGGPAYPPPFTASVNYQGYPPPWSDPAYPVPYPTVDTSCPTADNPN